MSRCVLVDYVKAFTMQGVIILAIIGAEKYTIYTEGKKV